MAFQIPGSIISAAEQAQASANAALEAAKPSYAEMLATIKSGSIFKDVSADLGALSNLGVNTSAITATIEKAKSSMAIDMAVAKAALTQKAKEAQAAGTTLSAADMEAAMAPLAVLKNLKSTLAGAMSSAANVASSAASTLGAALPGGVPNPADVINSVTASASAFSATVPSVTIPDPLNLGSTIPNPTYALFTANPVNASKLSALDGLASAASSLGSGLTSTLGGFAAAAAAAKSDIIGTLKADTMLASLTKSLPAGLSDIVSNNLNLGSIDPYVAIKAQEATINTTVEKTADPVRPKSNSTLLTNITSIPIPDDINRRIWAHELKGLATDRDAKGEAFWKSMGSSLTASEEARDTAKNAWFASLFTSEQEAIRQQSIAIKNSKPDSNDWTPEEAAIRAQSKANADKVYETPRFIEVDTLRETYNQYVDWYDVAYKTWIGSGSRFTLPAEILKLFGTYKP